jgi:hypothetical protein
MRAPSPAVSAEEIAELKRVSAAQLDAMTAGNLEEVRLLLGTRQRLLDGLRGRAVRPGDLETIVATVGRTVGALQAEMQRVEAVLSHLDAGGRALPRYAMNAATPAAYLDQLR